MRWQIDKVDFHSSHSEACVVLREETIFSFHGFNFYYSLILFFLQTLIVFVYQATAEVQALVLAVDLVWSGLVHMDLEDMDIHIPLVLLTGTGESLSPWWPTFWVHQDCHGFWIHLRIDSMMGLVSMVHPQTSLYWLQFGFWSSHCWILSCAKSWSSMLVPPVVSCKVEFCYIFF